MYFLGVVEDGVFMAIFKNGTTDNLMQALIKAGTISSYLKDKEAMMNNRTIADYLNLIIEAKGLKKSFAIQGADIDRVYGYEIFRGKKSPRRDIIIRLLIASDIELEDIQYILKNTGYPILYPKNVRDATIIFCIKNKCNVMKTNELLHDMCYKTI